VTPQEKLEEIEKTFKMQPAFWTRSDAQYLIARVRQLEVAINLWDGTDDDFGEVWSAQQEALSTNPCEKE